MTADAWTEATSRGLSDYWRIDRSSDRSRELASILGGVATQAELVQRRLLGPGRRSQPHSLPPVILDPRLLSGFGAPVPSRAVDCLTGLAVRAAALRALSVDSSLGDGWEQLSADERREFTHVHRALEEAYISARLAALSKTLVQYLRVMRETLGIGCGRKGGEQHWGAPTREAVLGLWLESKLTGGRVSGAGDNDIAAAVAALDAETKQYMATRGARQRLSLAVSIWRWLSTLPRAAGDGELWWSWTPEGAAGGDADEVAAQLRANVSGGGEGGRLVDLGQYEQEERSASLDDGRGEVRPGGAAVRMLTDELRDSGLRAAVTAIKDAAFDPDEYERVRAEVTEEVLAMRRVFARLDDVGSRWRYGLKRGRLDGRGLTKAAAGKADVFKLRQRRRGDTLALVFLIDVSASMRSYMPVVNRAACVVAEALRQLAPRVWYEVLTYTSGGLHPGAPVQLTRLAASGMLLSLRDVWTDGGTPTGEAIAAAALVLRGRLASRKLVLHFTDGHPKDTYVVRQALELSRRTDVDVLTVSVGSSQEALYGAGKCEVAYSVSELTAVLARLLPRICRQTG